MTLPIAVSTTSFESSENWVGLQLADVLAGSFARAADWYFGGQDSSDSYGRDLISLFGEVPVNPLLPSTAVTPEELGTIGKNAVDPNEYFAKILYNLKNKPKSP